MVLSEDMTGSSLKKLFVVTDFHFAHEVMSLTGFNVSNYFCNLLSQQVCVR